MRRRGHKRKSEDCNIDKTLQVENKRNLNNLDYEFKELIKDIHFDFIDVEEILNRISIKMEYIHDLMSGAIIMYSVEDNLIGENRRKCMDLFTDSALISQKLINNEISDLVVNPNFSTYELRLDCLTVILTTFNYLIEIYSKENNITKVLKYGNTVIILEKEIRRIKEKLNIKIS